MTKIKYKKLNFYLLLVIISLIPLFLHYQENHREMERYRIEGAKDLTEQLRKEGGELQYFRAQFNRQNSSNMILDNE